MIIEVSPTNSVVLDGSGNGQCAIGPPSGTKWALRLATLAVSTSTKQPQGLLYRGSASGPQELVDSTYTGAQASSAKVGGALYYPGQLLWAVWKGGDAGARANIQAYGQQGARSDPLAGSPPGEGFANPVVAGTALIIPAINSPNFVHNSAGWSVNQDGTVEFNNATLRGGAQSPNYVAGSTGWAVKSDGSAEFNNAIVRGELDVGDAAPGSRIVATRTIPSALNTFYTGLGETVTAALLFYDAGGGYEYIANISGGGLAIGIVTSGGTVQELEFKWSGVSNQGVNMSREIFYENQGTVEAWHALTLNAPWSNRGAGFPVLSYRLVPSPANNVQLVGQLTVGGAASGSVIATLPAGYRPLTAIGGAAGNDGNADILIEVETNGDIKAFGVFGTHIQINQLIPLDL